ncbi:uncharacterized protein DSM5745_03573 [Aspergillus mulundensis]|uniref:Archaemetzincin-2 n=1 Tax=Aspergillus mulundensis TaxID=1810919 RepID=A0A3D8SL69_9EURO|nr:Uncharacterized protein DSM5745_03573 [Aspergillus mulundensis]RDW86931.1 Uncharacterized protein DSM5745_03573 [Aspergillus mulundensis]
MPPKNVSQQKTCSHQSLTYSPSPYASQINYTQPSLKDCQSATKPSLPNIPAPATRTDNENFPAPLVLPGDDLALDPEYPPQSFQEWYDEEERNAVTAKRKTVYIIGPPGIDKSVKEIESWTIPNVSSPRAEENPAKPAMEAITPYLSAFFHGLPVKELKPAASKWKFVPWTESGSKSRKSKKAKESYIALSTPTDEEIRIRARPCPASDGLYTHQLNLDDLLDVAIAILPSDAYALCMLTHYDLYEDDDDLFVCGRAYGGSRVAVVSTARYNPLLDEALGVEGAHAWPGAHCAEYVEGVCRENDDGPKTKRARTRTPKPKVPEKRNGPLEAAIAAFNHREEGQDNGRNTLSSLWLYRTLRTVSHELCHCFGLDHCVYYACIMQGSASLPEDARQPPYLCPVDLAKVLAATGSSAAERDRALLVYCEQKGVKGDRHFGGFAAWLGASLRLS